LAAASSFALSSTPDAVAGFTVTAVVVKRVDCDML
jgi:hypothetical protein